MCLEMGTGSTALTMSLLSEGPMGARELDLVMTWVGSDLD